MWGTIYQMRTERVNMVQTVVRILNINFFHIKIVNEWICFKTSLNTIISDIALHLAAGLAT